MKNSKLIEILVKLAPTEVSRLQSFMASPYFVKQKSLVEFGDIILTEYPDFNESKVNEKIIYERLFPRQKFKNQTIHDLMTLMIASIHKFLAVENFLVDEIEEKLRLMEELRIKDTGNDFLRSGNKLVKILESGNKDEKYYFHLMKYENELEQYYSSSKGHLGSSKYIQNKSNALDLYYFASKLKLASNIINDQNVFSTQYDFTLLNEIIDYVNTNIEKLQPIQAVSIYYRIILTLTKPEEDRHFFDLKSDLEKATDNFSRNDLRDMYAFAQNYCIKKLNSGRIEYENELFNLYRKLLETGIILENNYLSQWDYKNITSIGLRLHEYEWIENFLQSKKELIYPSFRDIAYSFNLSNFYYEKKDFKNTLKMLNQFNDALNKIEDPDFDDTFYNLDSRSLLLKVYYELNDDEPFRALIRSFKLFLERNKKVSDRHRIIYLNLIKYTKKMNDLRSKISLRPEKEIKKLFEALKEKVLTEKNIVNPAWLKSQVLELEKEINNGGKSRS